MIHCHDPVTAEELLADNMPLRGYRIAAIASFDSFLKTAQILLAACKDAGAEVELLLIPVSGREPSAHQLATIGLDKPLPCVSWEGLFEDPAITKADGLILLLHGKGMRECLLRLHFAAQKPASIPVLVSAYPGLVFREHLHGFFDRAPVDLLCLNGKVDADIYREAGRGSGVDTSNVCESGLPLLWGLSAMPVRQDGAIVFFEQPSVPSSALEREFLAHSLIQLSNRLPNHRIILKPRTRAQDATLHNSKGYLELIVKKMAKAGDRLPTISHAPVLELLDGCRLALTVSSTAALEALALGVPTRILSDFGVNETLGNAYFAATGLFAPMAEITGFEVSIDISDWLEARAAPQHGRERFVNRFAAALGKHRLQRRSSNRIMVTPSLGSAQWLSYAEARAGVAGAVTGQPAGPTALRRFLRQSHVLRTGYRWLKRGLSK